MSTLFVWAAVERPPKVTAAVIIGIRMWLGREREAREALPVVTSNIEPIQARAREGSGSSVRNSARTENKTIYPPTLVRTEKACSIALSRRRKEKVNFFEAGEDMCSDLCPQSS